MTERFLGGTSGVTKIEFSERKKYATEINKMSASFLNTIYEKKLYGFINENYEVIAPTGVPVLFGPYAGTITGLNHTVSIFNKFRDHYTNLVNNNTSIVVPDQIIGLKPNKSYVNFEEQYFDFSRTAALVLSQELRDSGMNENSSFVDFVNLLNTIIFRRELKKYKFTKSGYALSEFSSAFHTGLYIDLGSGEDPQIDQAKIDLVTHPDFSCYAKYATIFGMKVDFNCPWRLIVDLDSPIVQSNILNGRATTNFNSFYTDLYTLKVGYDDFWSLKSFYELLFLQVKTDLGVEVVPGGFSNLPTDFWIKALLTNRFKELGLLHDPLESTELFESTVHKAKSIKSMYGLSGPSGAIGFINAFCADTLRFIMEGV
tara:strand:+ start:1980 stop:3095 length:1116 start_codon:yes stop_codon:yes gene_type:complete